MKEVIACPKCFTIVLKSRFVGNKLIERLVLIMKKKLKIPDQLVCSHKLIKKLVEIAKKNPDSISVEKVKCPKCLEFKPESVTC